MSNDHPEDVPGDLADDEFTLEASTPTVRPGDLDALEATALAAAEQWTALAALALHGDQYRRTSALEQLAAGADDPHAFTWLWSVLVARSGTPDWLATRAMPKEVAVPPDLLAIVAAEAADASSGNPARDVARAEILKRQHPATAGALKLATAVLTAETAVVPEVREEAARVLGGSSEPAARAALLTAAAEASAWLERAGLLTYLSPPLSEQETAALLAAVEEGHKHLSTHLSATDVRWSRVQHLVAALPGPERLPVLSQPWWSAGLFSDRSRAGSCCGGVVLVAGLGVEWGAVAQA